MATSRPRAQRRRTGKPGSLGAAINRRGERLTSNEVIASEGRRADGTSESSRLKRAYAARRDHVRTHQVRVDPGIGRGRVAGVAAVHPLLQLALSLAEGRRGAAAAAVGPRRFADVRPRRAARGGLRAQLGVDPQDAGEPDDRLLVADAEGRRLQGDRRRLRLRADLRRESHRDLRGAQAVAGRGRHGVVDAGSPGPGARRRRRRRRHGRLPGAPGPVQPLVLPPRDDRRPPRAVGAEIRPIPQAPPRARRRRRQRGRVDLRQDRRPRHGGHVRQGWRRRRVRQAFESPELGRARRRARLPHVLVHRLRPRPIGRLFLLARARDRPRDGRGPRRHGPRRARADVDRRPDEAGAGRAHGGGRRADARRQGDGPSHARRQGLRLGGVVPGVGEASAQDGTRAFAAPSPGPRR